MRNPVLQGHPLKVNRQSLQAKSLCCAYLLGKPNARDLLNKHNATNNGANWQPTANGYAAEFNGTSDYIATASGTIGGGVTGLTISCWVKPNTIADDEPFLARWTDPGNFVFLFSLSGTTGQFEAVVRNTDETNLKQIADNNELSTGTWTQVAFVWRGANIIDLYVNGQEVPSTRDSDSSPTATPTLSSPLEIGGRSNDNLWFDGQIQDVRIYDRALSHQEMWQSVRPATRWDIIRPAFPAWGFVPTGTTYNKSAAGILTPAGTTVRAISTTKTGAITPSATLARQTSKTGAGSITPAGTLAAIKTALRSVSGAIAPAGALSRQTAKGVAGVIAPVGAVVKQITKSAAGSIAPSGSLSSIKTVLLSLAGAILPSGALSRQTGKAVAGVITPSGSIARRIAKTIAGTLALAGALARSFVSGSAAKCDVEITVAAVTDCTVTVQAVTNLSVGVATR